MKTLFNPVRTLRDQLFDIRTAVIASGALTVSARRRALLTELKPRNSLID